MIKAILVFNNQGKPRLTKFFIHYVSFWRKVMREKVFQLLPSHQTEDEEQSIIKEVFHMVSKRDESSCNFLEGSRYMIN